MFKFFQFLNIIQINGFRFARDRLNLVATITVSLVLINLSVVATGTLKEDYKLYRERNLIYIESNDKSSPTQTLTNALRNEIESKVISSQLSAILGVQVQRLYKKQITCKNEKFYAEINFISSDDNWTGAPSIEISDKLNFIDGAGYGLISESISELYRDISDLKMSMPMNLCGFPMRYAGKLQSRHEMIFSGFAGENFVILSKGDLLNWFSDYEVVYFINENKSKWSGSKELDGLLHYISPSLGLKSAMSIEINASIIKLLKVLDLAVAVFMVVLSLGLGLIVSSGLSALIRENWHEIALKSLFGASRTQISLEIIFEFLSLFVFSIIFAFVIMLAMVYIFATFFAVNFHFDWSLLYINLGAVLFSLPFVLRPIRIAFEMEPNKLLNDIF